MGVAMAVRGYSRSAPLQFPRVSAESGAQRSVANARLDNTTKNVSPPREREKRDKRHELRGVLWNESGLPRVAACGRRRIKAANVPINQTADSAYLANIQLCGSVHSCPVCAAKIRQRRAVEIDRVVKAHMDRGGIALFQTFTLPHDIDDDLSCLLKTVAGAFRKVISGRGYMDDKRDYSITASIRASEVTFGKAGAHPHLHVIFFCDRSLSPAQIRTLQFRLFARWTSAVEAVGYRAPLIGLCPIERVTESGLGAYVQKFVMTADSNRRLGMEMTRHDLKLGRRTGRTPFQVLADFAATGDCADLALWHEWEQASKGMQSITWSKGLKARFGIAEKTDEEIAAEEVGGTTICELTPEQWNTVKREPMGPLRVIQIAEREGAEGVFRWILEADLRRQRRLAGCDNSGAN